MQYFCRELNFCTTGNSKGLHRFLFQLKTVFQEWEMPKKMFYCPWATMLSVGLLTRCEMLQWVISILNFLWWYILWWVSNVFILPSMTGFCPDYSSLAHTGLQVHGNLYQKGDFVTTWVTQPAQKPYPKNMNAEMRPWNTNPMDLSVHCNVEMRTETFSSFSQTEIVLFCLEQVQNIMLFAKLYLMGEKRESLRICILLWKKYFDGKLPIN